MSFYTLPHKHYCGSICDRFLLAIAPYHEDLVVAVECVYSWCWLADLCAREAFPSSSVTPSTSPHPRRQGQERPRGLREDRSAPARRADAPRPYPADMRATRDLMRRRLLFVRQRGSLLAHKLGRAVYYMLARKQAFDPQRFATS
jgi:hypothetical protein